MSKTNWGLDLSHSQLTFKIKHMMISNVTGHFRKFDVEVETENGSFDNAKVKVTVDLHSISTNNEARDQHLLETDFFDVKNSPYLIFESTKIVGKDGDNLVVEGNLTMRGITRGITLDARFNGVGKDPWGNVKAGFELSGSVNRNDWGITYNTPLEAGGLILGEQVKISSEIQLLKLVKEEAS